jgi:hypothetical protein
MNSQSGTAAKKGENWKNFKVFAGFDWYRPTPSSRLAYRVPQPNDSSANQKGVFSVT